MRLPWLKSRFAVLIGLSLILVMTVIPASSATDSILNNDRALFWSITKDGQVSGYLLGTIHSEDTRVLEFSVDLLEKLRSSDVFAMELVPDLPTLSRLTDFMHYPDGQSIESVIGSDRYNELLTALSAYGVPADFISRMKPWAAMMTLSTPPPKTGFFMDLSLSLRASGNGLKVVGLETLEQQISFLENMPIPMQLSLLDQAIDESDQVTQVHDQMIGLYLQNDLVALQAESAEQLQVVGEEASQYFMESGINARNHRMIENLLLQLENKTVFAAVGALHLPGSEGLIKLLRNRGYQLSPLGSPLSGAKPGADD